MNIVFDKLRKDLYREYEAEISSMMESLDPSHYLTQEEQEEQEEVPAHLRFSYTKQQLLCLRAAKITPSHLQTIQREARKGDIHGKENGEVSHGENNEDDKIWKQKEVEMLEREADLEKLLRGFQQGILENPDGYTAVEKIHLHRLQSEAVRILRNSLVAQEAYRENRKVPSSPHEIVAHTTEEKEIEKESEEATVEGKTQVRTAVSVTHHDLVSANNGTAVDEWKKELEESHRERKEPLHKEEGEGTQARISDWKVHVDNFLAVKEGGRHGPAYTKQRLGILDLLDRRLREEELTRKVNALI